MCDWLIDFQELYWVSVWLSLFDWLIIMVFYFSFSCLKHECFFPYKSALCQCFHLGCDKTFSHFHSIKKIKLKNVLPKNKKWQYWQWGFKMVMCDGQKGCKYWKLLISSWPLKTIGIKIKLCTGISSTSITVLNGEAIHGVAGQMSYKRELSHWKLP